jgi:hypothetical protein
MLDLWYLSKLRSGSVTSEMFRAVYTQRCDVNVRNSLAADSSSSVSSVRIYLGWCKGNENKMIYSYFRETSAYICAGFISRIHTGTA